MAEIAEMDLIICKYAKRGFELLFIVKKRVSQRTVRLVFANYIVADMVHHITGSLKMFWKLSFAMKRYMISDAKHNYSFHTNSVDIFKRKIVSYKGWFNINARY